MEKLMREMKQTEMGIVVSGCPSCEGHIVMRTASSLHFEVMDLTNLGPNNCWTGDQTDNEMIVKILFDK